jgi:xanthine/uracil permease
MRTRPEIANVLPILIALVLGAAVAYVVFLRGPLQDRNDLRAKAEKAVPVITVPAVRPDRTTLKVAKRATARSSPVALRELAGQAEHLSGATITDARYTRNTGQRTLTGSVQFTGTAHQVAAFVSRLDNSVRLTAKAQIRGSGPLITITKFQARETGNGYAAVVDFTHRY